MNYVMTQSGDEAWVLGRLEKLKREIKKLERFYATNYRKTGTNIVPLLFFSGAIIVLPNISTIWQRAVMMAGAISLIILLNFVHGKLLPLAVIYLSEKPKGLFAKISPEVISWALATTAGAAGALLAKLLSE
ncbi:MAG: hypothetical protein VX640_04960 [Pseudomonadota bacterium]|nr:hypothetical protein [Pseudomonadota bacterium]